MFRRNRLVGTKHRREAVLPCKASKGFGSSKRMLKDPSGKPGLAKTPQQAADRALAEASRSRPKGVRPVDPKEAARGRVDYVQVKDWANGKAADAGELQMVPGSGGTGYATGDTGSGPGSSSSSSSSNQTAPFYQQLAHHAQYLERQGALAIASDTAKPYLPFESWKYSLQRYRQYLAEVAAVHQALEDALQLALAAPAPLAAAAADTQQSVMASDTSSSSSSSDGSGTWAVPGRDAEVLAAPAAYAALQCFGPASGLWRAAAAQADLQALCRSAAAGPGAGQSPAPQQMQVASPKAGNQQQQHSAGAHASQNAVAYGKYLLQLGNAAAAATEAAAVLATPSGDALVAEDAEGEAAVLKLLAHAYALQVQQQCLGTRIGAAATEKLQLLSARAVSLYMDYPNSIRGEPVQQLMHITDDAGRRLSAAGRQAVLDELPRALKKSALLLAPLATHA